MIRIINKKQHILLVMIILFLASCSVVKHNSHCEPNTDTIGYHVTYLNSKYRITIYNNSKKSLYLFNSYIYDKAIKDSSYKAKILYEYDSKDSTYNLLLLPIIPSLTLFPNDRVLLDITKRISEKDQMTYDFRPIKSNDSLVLDFDLNFVANNDFIVDFHPHLLSLFDNIEIPSKTTRLTGRIIFLHFAFYRDIHNLNSRHFYCKHSNKYEKKAKAYNIVRIPVELNWAR